VAKELEISSLEKRKKLKEKIRERQRIESEIEKELSQSLSLSIALILSLLLLGTVFFHYSENLKWIDALYVSGITMTSVGYGDITPTNDASKIFAVFFAIISISVLFYSASTISSEILARVKERVLIARLKRLEEGEPETDTSRVKTSSKEEKEERSFFGF